jgi:hypothetical protein
MKNLILLFKNLWWLMTHDLKREHNEEIYHIGRLKEKINCFIIEGRP